VTPGGRVEELARALDRPRSAASREDGIRPFLELAATLRSFESAPAPLEFRESLRHRLMSEALAVDSRPVVTIAPPAAPTQTTRSRLARALAAAVAAFVVLALFGSATLRAVPGDLLYGVKRQAESIELIAVRDELGRGHALLARAERRLAEIRTLAERRQRGRIAKTMADMDRSTSRGAALLSFVASKTGRLEPLADLDAFTVRQQKGLAEITALLGADERLRADQSARLLLAIQESTQEAMARLSCTVGCDAVPQQQTASTSQPAPSSQSPGGAPSARDPGAVPPAPPGAPGRPALPVSPGGVAPQAGTPSLPQAPSAPSAAPVPGPAADTRPADQPAAAAQAAVGSAVATVGSATAPSGIGTQVPAAPAAPAVPNVPVVPPAGSSLGVIVPRAPPSPAPPHPAPPSPAPPSPAPPSPALPPPPLPSPTLATPTLPTSSSSAAVVVTTPPASVITKPPLPAPLPSVSVAVPVPPPPSPPGLPTLP
jgi:hypothetical protein